MLLTLSTPSLAVHELQTRFRGAIRRPLTGPLIDSPRSTRRQLLSLGLGLPLVAGCAAFDYRNEDAPQARTRVPAVDPPPRIALVLGSGGPRVYAHIGVLRVLEEAGVVPDLVVGSSVGSLVGVFWASGLDAAEIDRRSMQGGPLTVFDPSLFADRGWIRGQRLQDYVNDRLAARTLEQLPRRVIVMSCPTTTNASYRIVDVL